MMKKQISLILAALVLFFASAAGAAENEGVAMYTADGKRIITLGTWYNQFYFSRHSDITDDPKLSFPETAQMRLDNMRRLEEKYNILLEYANLTFEGIQESMHTSIPDGMPDVDVYEADLQFAIPAVMNDYAVSLEAMNLADTDVFNEQIVMKHLKLPGQSESYLFSPAALGATNAYVLAYNMDMIRENGLENPQDLYDRGEWTWDVWLEYLRTLTKDSDSDGLTDIYGYSGYWTHMLRNLLFSNGATIAAEPQETLSSPETQEVLAFVNTLYNEDKVARPWDSSNWDINNSLYAAGLSAFWIGSDWLFDEQGGEDLPFEIGVVPWPCGPSGNPETNSHSQPSGNWYFIPVGAAEPRFVYDVLFDWFNWYDSDLSIGVDMQWSRDQYMTERNFAYVTMMDTKPGFDLWESLGVSFNLSPLLNGEQTVEEITLEFAPAYQEALSQYFR